MCSTQNVPVCRGWTQDDYGHVVKTRLGRSNCVVGRLGGYSCGNNGQWAGDMTDDVNSLFGIVMTC